MKNDTGDGGPTRYELFTYVIPVLTTILVCPYVGNMIFFGFHGVSYCAYLSEPVWVLLIDLIMFPSMLGCSAAEAVLVRRYLRYKKDNLRLVSMMRDFVLAGGLLSVLVVFIYPGITFILFPDGQSNRELKLLLLSALITGSIFGLLFSFSVFAGQGRGKNMGRDIEGPS